MKHSPGTHADFAIEREFTAAPETAWIQHLRGNRRTPATVR